jgi:hypothetical protein
MAHRIYAKWRELDYCGSTLAALFESSADLGRAEECPAPYFQIRNSSPSLQAAEGPKADSASGKENFETAFCINVSVNARQGMIFGHARNCIVNRIGVHVAPAK